MRLLETLFDIICPEQTRMNIKKENERLHSSRKSARENQKDLNKVFPNAPHAPSYFNAQEFINKLQETDKMSAYIYICNNTPGGALDYKLSGTRTKNSIEFENWGNYFFGATSESRGWNDQVSLYGAGAIQLLTGRFDSNNCNTKYHCDQPKDQKTRSGVAACR